MFFCILKIYLQILFLVLLIVVISFTVLIFPIFINIDACYLSKYKKVYFNVKLFGLFKIFKGYIEILNAEIIIHYTKKKAAILPIKNLITVKDKVKPLKDYHLLKYDSLLELGSETNVLNSFILSFIYNYGINFVTWFTYHKKPYFNINNKVVYVQNENVLNYLLNTVIALNLLMILISIIKILVGKMYNAITNRT